MSRYTVTAERGTRRWVLQCQEFPGALSEVTRLDQADIIREAIAFVADVPEDSVEYDLVPVVDAGAEAHLARSRRMRENALRLNAMAADELTLATEALKASGLTVRDIGFILGVSHQRAQQLVTRPLIGSVDPSTGAPIDLAEQDLVITVDVTPEHDEHDASASSERKGARVRSVSR